MTGNYDMIWKYTPLNQNKKGKWHILLYDSSVESVLNAINNGHYLYIDPWWNNSYTYKMRINLSDYNITLVNLTKYIEIPINNHMNETGKDITFTNDAENLEIPFDFDFINSSTFGVWVKIPNMTNPYIYMYYGNSLANYKNNSVETFSNLRHTVHFNNNTNNLGTADTFSLFNAPYFRNLSNSIMKMAIYSPNSTNSGFQSSGNIGWGNNWTMFFTLQNLGSSNQYLVYDAGLSFIVDIGGYCSPGNQHICIYTGGWSDCSGADVTPGIMHTITIMSNTTKVSCYIDGERKGIINGAGSPGVAKYMFRNDDSGKSWTGNITDYQMYDNFIPESWIKQLSQNQNYSSYIIGSEEVQAPTAPSFQNYSKYPQDPVNYTLNGSYTFNVTINKGNGTQGIEFNKINYTMSKDVTNMSNITILDLKTGVYIYYFWSYGDGGTYNISANFSYIINKATPTLNLTLFPPSPITYGTNSTFICLNPFGEITELWANTVNITTQNNESVNRTSGTYTLNCSWNGNENYTYSQIISNYIITGQSSSFSFFTFDFTSFTNVVIFIFAVVVSIVILIYLSALVGSICLIVEGVILLINLDNKFIGLAFLIGAVLTAFIDKR